MDPERKRQWVEALRSGEYKQGVGRLRTDFSNGPKYCCLGVACELARKAGVVTYQDSYYIGPDDGRVRRKSESVLPDAVVEWLGLDLCLDSCDPIVRTPVSNYTIGRTLSYLNDGVMSFPKIADLIEQQL